jgi:HSP20 family protein
MRRTESWDPFRELETINDRFNRLFGWTRGGADKEALSLADWAPSVDISESNKDYRIRAELPDVKKDDVEVVCEKGVLTIHGQRKQEKEEKDTKYHRRELAYGSFTRSFTLPDDADDASITAQFKDGILEVVIAKSATKPPAKKQIAVQ